MNELIAWLSQKIAVGQEVSPTQLRLHIQEFASEKDEAISGGEVFWLTRCGFLSPFPHTRLC